MPSIRGAVERLRNQVRGRRSPDRSWFWPILDEYRDAVGRPLEEIEIDWFRRLAPQAGMSQDEIARYVAARRWIESPKSEIEVRQLIRLLEGFFHPEEPFTYLEFGTCFGTTLAQILGHFKNARAIGAEVLEPRFAVTRWVIDRKDAEWDLARRTQLYRGSTEEIALAPDSVDVVYMDTDHRYPDDFDYIVHLLNGGALRKRFVFFGDDPLHTGTNKSRLRFIAEYGARYKIITREDRNLWWFFP